MVQEFSDLGREFKRHKEIAADLHELSKKIGQSALLISIGEEEGVREDLQKQRISFEGGIRKLNDKNEIDEVARIFAVGFE